jgi:hypothetical protein
MATEHFEDAMTWLRIERELYQARKWDYEDEDKEWTHERWIEQINMYLHRAKVLGLDNPLGRQAAAKATATCVAMFENLFANFKTVPMPGVASGEITGEFPGEYK